MLKYIDSQIVFREFPDEVSLAINLTCCPNTCAGCHSDYLRKDIGTVLDEKELDALIKSNDGISCVGFMGGDNDTLTLAVLASYVKNTHKLKTGWYSGKDTLEIENPEQYFDYVKLGHYDEKLGPLDSETTNQHMYEYRPCYSGCTIGKCWKDITDKFWKQK